MRKFWPALSLLVILPLTAQARVFSFKDSNLAAYLRGTGGFSEVEQDPFIHSSGVGTSVEAKTDYSYSGEIGMLFGMGESVRVRLGVELIQHFPIKDATGTNASGTERFQLESSTTVFNPNVAFEMTYAAAGNTRYFFELGAGYADVTVENRYTMAATSDLGIGDYNEKLTALGYSGTFAFGLETLFVDNTTFSLVAGYRYLPVPELKYKGDAITAQSPSGVAKGDVAKNHDGSNRSLDLSGIFVGLSLRFYLNFL